MKPSLLMKWIMEFTLIYYLDQLVTHQVNMLKNTQLINREEIIMRPFACLFFYFIIQTGCRENHQQ